MYFIMLLENTLSRTLTLAEGKMRLDASCKRLLSHKVILAWIMKGCMEEYQNCTLDEIINNYIIGLPEISQKGVHPDESSSEPESVSGLNTSDNTLTEGLVTYDIRFYALLPDKKRPIRLIINVEAQNNFYPGYPLIKRGVYYGGRQISAQYGTEFASSHYEKLKKVYSVWICIHPPKRRQNTINLYQLTERHLVGVSKFPKSNYDLMTIILICLGNPYENVTCDLLRLLDVLFSKEITADKKKTILREEFGIALTYDMEKEVNIMCNYSDYVEEVATKRGLKRGLKLGMDKGSFMTLSSLVKDGILKPEDAAKRMNITEAAFRERMIREK